MDPAGVYSSPPYYASVPGWIVDATGGYHPVPFDGYEVSVNAFGYIPVDAILNNYNDFQFQIIWLEPYAIVPPLEGTEYSEADELLQTAGLILGTTQEIPSVEIPAGIIISQTPEAGELVVQGTAIDLTVSSGPIILPNLVGLTEAEAKLIIQNLGLELGDIEWDYSATYSAGLVVSQEPQSNSELALGEIVSLIISLGPIPTSTPSLTPTSTPRLTPTNNPPSVSIIYEPKEGPAPLSVELIGSATDTDGLLVQTGWTFDGLDFVDARCAISSATLESVTYYFFFEPGIYSVNFHAWDDHFCVVSASGEVVVWTPTPTFTLTPSSTMIPTSTETLTPTHTPTITGTSTPTMTNTPESTPTATPIPDSAFDLDGNKVIGVGDLLILIQMDKTFNSKGDFNQDGKIDSNDLFYFAGRWGKKIQ